MVSRSLIAEIDDVSTVICAPVDSEILGLEREVVLGSPEGLPRTCAVRCDFLALMFKRKLTQFVSSLSPAKTKELNRAINYALESGEADP